MTAKARPLIMIWSSMSDNNDYVQNISVSDSGKIIGPWRHDEDLLYRSDGGHGMIFRAFNGDLFLSTYAQ